MRFDAAEAVARAVLYEGYLLYPYRDTALKNRKRWNFGVLRPRGDAERTVGERWRVSAQLPARGARGALLAARARFLTQEAATGEVREHTVDLEALTAEEGRAEKGFRFGDVVGSLEARLERLDGGALRATAALSNLSAAGGAALLSAHLLLGLDNDVFGSVIDPPEDLQPAARACASEGLWPALIGGEREAPVALAAPVILPDDAKVAPESAGDLFDATEIDEILSLRVLTLSDEEKALLRDGDPRAAALLRRTEALTAEQWARLHGTLRRP